MFSIRYTVAFILALQSFSAIAEVLASSSDLSSSSSAWPTDYPSTEGNCVSGTYTFKSDRIKDISPSESPPKDFSYSDYDFVVLAKNNITVTDGELDMTVSKSGGAGLTKMAWSRWIKYGRISFKIKAPATAGLVTTFITLSYDGDEIDWELTGVTPTTAQSNVFYKGIAEYDVHSGSHALSSSMAEEHTYTIDWTDTELKWEIDGTVVRTITPTTEKSAYISSSEQWYPTTVSMIQFSLWQGSDDWTGTLDWSQDSYSASFSELTVQCYDANMNSVSEYPEGSKKASSTASKKKDDDNGALNTMPAVLLLPLVPAAAAWLFSLL